MVKSCIKSKSLLNAPRKKVTFSDKKWVGILEVPKNESRVGYWYFDAVRQYDINIKIWQSFASRLNFKKNFYVPVRRHDFYKKKWQSFANRLLLQK